MADEDEYLLTTLPQCFVFKIPPRSAAGHRAADWPKDHLWVGEMKVVGKGETAYIRLVSPDGKEFASAPVRFGEPSPIEKVVDSSRYFVLRVENKAGKRAYIGVAFRNRSDAFDLNVALKDHEEQVKIDRGEVDPLKLAPVGDLSLKEGQKLTVSLGAKGKSSASKSSSSKSGSKGLRALAPPPTGGRSGTNENLLGASFSSPPAPAPAPAPARTPAASGGGGGGGGSDDWVSF